MPKLLGNLHDHFITKYLDTSESKIIGHERTVFCLHKKGYLIPSSIMIKVLPHLDQGIQMVAFLKEIHTQFLVTSSDTPTTHTLNVEEEHYLIYRFYSSHLSSQKH